MSVDWTKYPPLPDPPAFPECRCKPDSQKMNTLATMIMAARPDFGEVDSETMKAAGAIMTDRPDFDEAEFRKYWPTPELADMALEIRSRVRENWALPDKMLYPNDSLMLLYEYKLTGDDEDYEDFFMDIGFIPLYAIYDYDKTFAELTEKALKFRRETEAAEKNEKQTP